MAFSKVKWIILAWVCAMSFALSSCAIDGTSGRSGTFSDSDLTWELSRTDDGEVILYIRGEGEIPELLINIPGPWKNTVDSQAQVQKIVIEDGVTSIGRNSFQGWRDVTQVSIPASVEKVGSEAFNNCVMLESIEVDSENKHYQSMDGILYNKDLTALIRCPEGVTEVVLPGGLNRIANGAFYDCEHITELVIPEYVSTIGLGTFWGCTNLAKIVIPDSVTRIEDDGSGFNGIGNCFSSTKWYETQPDGLVYAGKVLCGYKGDVPTNLDLVLSDNTSQIADCAFNDCVGLRSIVIPQGVESIGIWCFMGCEDLISITIPDSVVYIGPGAFRDCNAATIYYAGTAEQWKSIGRNQPGVTPHVNPVESITVITDCQ